MVVCDKCGSLNGMGAFTIHFNCADTQDCNLNQVFDLCSDCYKKMLTEFRNQERENIHEYLEPILKEEHKCEKN